MVQMTGRLVRRLAMLASAACVATLMVVIGGTTLSPANAADCNDTVAWNQGYNNRYDNAFSQDYVSQNNGPYDVCGQVNWAHQWTDIRLHCAGYNSNGVVWAHIRNINYDSRGWVRGAKLTAYVQSQPVWPC